MAQSADSTNTMNVVCDEDKEFDVKRTLLPRIKAIYSNPHLVQQDSIKVANLRVESLQKIVQWLEHYPENPIAQNGNMEYSDWDHSFFAVLTGESFLSLINTGKMLQVDGFFGYSMKYLEKRWFTLSLAEQIAMDFVNSLGGDESLIAIANYLLEK